MNSLRRNTLLYIIYEAGNFQPAIDLCTEIKKHRGINCILYSPYFLPKTEQYKEVAAEFDLIYLHEATALGGDADIEGQMPAGYFVENVVDFRVQSAPKIQVRARLINQFARKWVRNFPYWQSYYKKRVEHIEDLLYKLNVSHVILPEDNVERDSACWTRAIQSMGGKAFVISYASITPHEAAIAYWSNNEYAVRRIEDRFVQWLMPKWCYVYNKKAMLRLPSARVLAMESLNLAPKRPWVVNTGKMDGVLVESQFMRKRFVSQGVDPAAIRVTGAMPLDKISHSVIGVANHRKKRLEDLGCDENRKTIVCAIPPNQYPHVPANGHPTYKDLIGDYIAGLKKAANNFNIILSLHPSLNIKDIEGIELKPALIHHGSVMEILPMADLYVATVSTTIKWALACGIPVVNYDCYNYDYVDFSDLKQVMECNTSDEFNKIMMSFTKSDFLQEKTKIAQDCARHFGVLDGKSIERVIEVIFEGA